MSDVCAHNKMKNFNPQIIVSTKVFIDEQRRYKPQPTSQICFYRKTTIESRLLTNPATMKIIDNVKLI